MGHEVEAEALSESLHLRHGDHLAARPAQHHDMRVVDHHVIGRAAHIFQSLGEKHLTVEPLKRGVNLKEQHARVTQDGRRSLRLVFPPAHFDFVRRCVMLHLCARLEVILPGRRYRFLSDAVPAAECGQRRVGQGRATCQQFFMDSHEIPLAGDGKLQDLLPVWFGLLRPVNLRHGG